MKISNVSDRIVRVDGRNLRYQSLGEGPPVVLLHESPRSSQALMPLANLLAPRFHVLAIDTPGYGLSDPLDMQNPEIEDFADAIVASLRQLGIKRVPIYGTHTGSTIAVAIAVRHPDLVSGIVLDGYPVFTQHERDLHETCYLPQFPPDWEGSHIVKLWSRVRDQYDFFPWYLRGNSSRLLTSRPDLARYRAVFRDFLSSGRAYSEAYAASFRFDASHYLQQVRSPLHIIARETDLLLDHLQRLPELPAGASAASCPSDALVWKERIEQILDTMPGDLVLPEVEQPQPSCDGSLTVVDGWLFLQSYGTTGTQNPLVLLHDLPGSGQLLADEARRRAGDGHVIVPELPGCGITAPSGNGPQCLTRFAAVLEQSLNLAGAERADIEGVGLSAAIATAVANLSTRFDATDGNGGAGQLAPAPDAPLPPRWDGADLLAIWYEIREAELSRARNLGSVAGMDLDRMHACFVAHCLSDGNSRLLKLAADQLMAQQSDLS